MKKKLVSHILFLGRSKNDVRLYMIEVNPWKCLDNTNRMDKEEEAYQEKYFNFARVFPVDQVPVLDFTGIVYSDIKKAEMLIKKSDTDGDENE